MVERYIFSEVCGLPARAWKKIDGPWVTYEDFLIVEAENAKLKAREANTKEGLRRLTTRIMASPDTVISAVNVDGIGMIGLFEHDIKVATGKDFVGLIDHLLTQEQDDGNN